MELSSSNIKKIHYILSKERFSHISRNRTLDFSAQALIIKESHPRIIYYTLGNGNPEKISFVF